MSGRRLILIFLAFVVVFAAALIWFQFFAYYERQHDLAALPVSGPPIPIAGYDGIDAATSPLKLRGCFRLDPVTVVRLPVAPDATPLVAPFWFRCFDARALTRDLAAGAATAHLISRDTPEGFDLMIAVYPDGRGFLWRQLNARFE
jgi:hypothetical protein